jgi:hypothetical protein
MGGKVIYDAHVLKADGVARGWPCQYKPASGLLQGAGFREVWSPIVDQL